METVKIGVIGGAGLYNMTEITDKTSITIDTPFGKPSADIVIGTLHGKRVAFIPRHGEGHVYTPSEVPYRANIYALKSLGVRFCIAANACGSLQEDHEPGHLVIPAQIYDNTKSERGGRSFFERGLVAHISVADPFSPELGDLILQATQSATESRVHRGGTIVIIEGPRFSTRGESVIYRQWGGCTIIGMTNAPEVFLAREAEIAYASIAHITDYDVWNEEEESVTVDLVIQTMKRNVANTQRAIAKTVEMIDEDAEYAAHSALKNAMMTKKDAMSPESITRLGPVVARYFAD